MIWDNDSDITSDVESGDCFVEKREGNRKIPSKSLPIKKQSLDLLSPPIDFSTLKWNKSVEAR